VIAGSTGRQALKAEAARIVRFADKRRKKLIRNHAAAAATASLSTSANSRRSLGASGINKSNALHSDGDLSQVCFCSHPGYTSIHNRCPMSQPEFAIAKPRSFCCFDAAT
jgi:hypothetical protein